MPDLPSRQQREAEIAAVLLLLMRDWRLRVTASPDWQVMARELSQPLGERLAEIYAEAASRLAEMQGLELDAARLQAEAIKWGAEQALDLARDFAERVMAEVNEAIRTAQSVEELEARLDAIFSEARAQAIGATETTRAVSAGEQVPVAQYEAETGETLAPVWQTERDAKVCPVCAPLDGQPDDVWGDEFPLGPPAHPNCRCYLEYEVAEHAYSVSDLPR